MRQLSVVAVCLCLSLSLLGQGVGLTSHHSLLDERALQLRVKQIEEFMARFVHPIDAEARPIPRLDDEKLFRAGIENLVEKSYHQKHRALVSSFSDAIHKKRPRLRFTDDFWYAELDCGVKYKGKSQAIKLYLRVEHIDGLKYKWVLVSAKGDCLELLPKRSNPGLIISPVEHEVNFMSLVDLLNTAPADGMNYSFKNHQVDQLLVFFSLMRAGVLTFEGVRDIRYHFFQAPGYIFRVGHYERQGSNVGWLIDDIRACKDEEKLLGNEHIFR